MLTTGKWEDDPFRFRQNMLFIIVLRWQTRCKARILESMLSYERDYSPPYDVVWFACGLLRGCKAEAACLPVPAGRSTKTLLTRS